MKIYIETHTIETRTGRNELSVYTYAFLLPVFFLPLSVVVLWLWRDCDCDFAPALTLTWLRLTGWSGRLIIISSRVCNAVRDDSDYDDDDNDDSWHFSPIRFLLLTLLLFFCLIDDWVLFAFYYWNAAMRFKKAIFAISNLQLRLGMYILLCVLKGENMCM